MKNKIIFKAKEFNNIKDIIYNSAVEFRDNIAFVIKNKVNDKTTYKDITYKAFLDDINYLGTGFYSIGLKDKRVAIMGKNRYEWVLAHYANLLGGIVSIPLDKDLQLEELETSLVRSKANAIVFDKKEEELIKQIKERNNTQITEYISMDGLDGYTNIYDILEKGKKEIEGGNTEYVDYEVDDNKMSILLFTSGTTAQSKAVMLSQKNIASNIYALQCVEDIRSTDTNIAFLPFHHIFGSTGMLVMLSNGVRTVFPDGLRYIKQNMKEYGVSIFVGVPVLIEAMYKAIFKEVEKQGKTKTVNTAIKVSNVLRKMNIDLRRKLFAPILDALGGKLRLVIMGGAASDPQIIKGFNDIGVDTAQGYGLSETAPVVAAENYKVTRSGSVGYPMINNTIEIVNKDENGIGEIRVKGPNVMLGYYEMPEETKEAIRDGWFYTGDLGKFDKDGILYITGRNKNLIVLKNGKKVFPEEIETLVNREELVLESMVFGLEDENDKNDITVSVKIVYDEEVIKEKYSDKTEDELYQIMWNRIKEINTSFPKYKHIQKLIVSHEELIKTTTKKVKRQEEIKKIKEEL